MLKDRTRDQIEEIRSRSSLKDVVERDHPLTRKGRLWFAAVRAEKTPSFAIYPDGKWYDFGTTEGGDVFKYVMMRDRVDFFDAVRILAKDAGVVFDPWEGEEEGKKSEFFARRRVQEVQTQIVQYLHTQLPDEIREFLRNHYGFTDETIDILSLGWSDGGTYTFFREEKYLDEDLLLSTGFFYRSGSDIIDHFRQRIVFPYWHNSHVVYACARYYAPRCVDPQEALHKYKKLMTHKPAKGDDPGRTYVSPYVENEYFYNEDALAEQHDYVVITEGVTDCISLKQFGFPTISPVATSFREDDHPKMLALLGNTSEVYLCNDNDVTPDGQRPGWKGAIKTAQFLFSKGKDVKLCRLPRPPDRTKIDVNEFLRESSDPRADFQKVLKEAKRLPDILLDEIPADLDPVAVDIRLKAFADSLAGISTSLLSECVKKIAFKFQLPPSEVKTLLKTRSTAVAKEQKKKEDEEADKRKKKAQDEARKSLPPKSRDSGGTGGTGGTNSDELRGIVKEDLGFYYVVTPFGQETISTFTLALKNVIHDERGMVVVTDINLISGAVIKDFVWPRSAWTSKRSFISAFPDVRMQFTGSDDNVQGLLRTLTKEATGHAVKGTSVIGYHEVSGEGRFVVPNGTLSKDGWMETPDIVYVDTGCSIAKRLCFEKDKVEEGRKVAEEALPLLLQVNELNVVLPILGHCFATVFKPRLQELMGHFPLLSVWGSPGSGKTSVIKDIFWRVQGVKKRSDTFSVTDTSFVLSKTMASSNAIWTPFDEYKPSDMKPREREQILRSIRRAYSGESNERGRQDQTTNAHSLVAPIVVMGESAIEGDSAIAERIIPVSPNKNTIDLNNSYGHAFTLLDAMDLHHIAPVYAQWALGVDATKILSEARHVYAQLMVKTKVSPRCVDNLVVMIFGMLCYQMFCEHVNVSVDISPSKVSATFSHVLDEMTSPDGLVKDAIDELMIDFHTMSQEERLTNGIHFKYELGSSTIYFHMPSCIAQYRKWIREQGDTDITNGKKSIKRILEEKKLREGSYVINTEAKPEIGMSRVISVAIDMEKLRKAIPQIQDFRADGVRRIQGALSSPVPN